MLNSFTRRTSEILRIFWPSALIISILLNILTMLRLQPASLDDRQYSYIGEDYPTELPLRLDTVALKFNDSDHLDHYGIVGERAWSEWKSLDHFPHGHGFVRLGPDGRLFGISMFHQIHCLQMVRLALIFGPNGHSGHCMNILRQGILCYADITLDPLVMTGTEDVTHVCRDWSQVYDYIIENQNGPLWWEEQQEQQIALQTGT
ncbi:hypothetical protein DFJ58DRAFT_891355 [Suillus subalutaceus]|uniref:uncharacterized protein n=1 Tax=Suillus subalutaceus TaxID=48586 RepID=UPI001B8739E8|nr:uncharacterized protein DFJ58DRAFT_891355 [Suillus subalutaceus]KAG1847634.1 hypothetical protein DFJ58DRAFT_891355 [Suillus subalutaceus]